MNSTPFVIQYTILSNKWGAVHLLVLFYYVALAKENHQLCW